MIERTFVTNEPFSLEPVLILSSGKRQGVRLGDVGLTLSGEGRLEPMSSALSRYAHYEGFLVLHCNRASPLKQVV